MKQTKLIAAVLLAGLIAWGFSTTSAIAEEVVIGFTGPLSGPAAQYGRDCVAGVELAIKDINKAGGIKIGDTSYTFKLVSYDDGIDPTAAVNNARRMVARDGAVAIFNPVFNTLAALMEINEQRGSEFLLNAYTSTPAVDQHKNKLTVAIPPPFSAYAIAFADSAWDRGWRKCAMVVTLGAYGDEWRKEFKRVWTAKGGEITADQPANYYTQTDFSSNLAAALATKPDFMLIGGPSATTGLVVEQARKLGYKGPFMMVDQAKLNYIVDVTFNGDISKMDNVWGVVRTLDLGIHSETKALMERFDKEQGIKVATSENFLNYSAMRILAAAMQKAGTVEDPTKIKAAYNDVLPLPVEQNPIMYVGLQDTRLLVQATIQHIENGEYSIPTQFIWWVDDKEEFQKIVDMQPPEHKVERKMLPLEDYVK